MAIHNADKSREMSEDTYIACAKYLERLGAAEYSAFASSKRRTSERYSPSDYHRELVKLLGERDEDAFKSLKMLEGRYSALGF